MDTAKNTTNLPFSKADSWRVFDEISPRYDLLNHLLSLGLDIHWRKCLRNFLPARNDKKILDLATGTGDVLIHLTRNNRHVHMAYGMDMAQKMLEIGRKKVELKGLAKNIEFIKGDINQVPFQNDYFDCTTIAFGIRNVEDPTQVLREMNRVLNKRGRALILEFSLPKNILLKKIHLFYLRNVVPILGFLFSGHYAAYKYLNQTIEEFPYGEQFCNLMRDAQFKNVRANPLLFGVATIYQGDKLS